MQNRLADAILLQQRVAQIVIHIAVSQAGINDLLVHCDSFREFARFIERVALPEKIVGGGGARRCGQQQCGRAEQQQRHRNRLISRAGTPDFARFNPLNHLFRVAEQGVHLAFIARGRRETGEIALLKAAFQQRGGFGVNAHFFEPPQPVAIRQARRRQIQFIADILAQRAGRGGVKLLRFAAFEQVGRAFQALHRPFVRAALPHVADVAHQPVEMAFI